VILAVLEDEGFPGFEAATLDLAHENDVVAFFVAAAVKTFEPGATSEQHGGTARPFAPTDACKTIEGLVAWLGTESPRPLDLVGRQNIDGVMRVAAKCRQAPGLDIQAPQDQGRIERDGIKRARRKADRLAVRAFGGDDRHSRGKLPERAPEVMHVVVGRGRVRMGGLRGARFGYFHRDGLRSTRTITEIL